MKTVTLEVKTKVLDDKGNAVLDADGKPTYKKWNIESKEFDARDITITVNGEAAQFLKADKVLELVNTQYQTNDKNESRRQETTGPAKSIKTDEALSRIMRALNCDEATARGYLGLAPASK